MYLQQAIDVYMPHIYIFCGTKWLFSAASLLSLGLNVLRALGWLLNNADPGP